MDRAEAVDEPPDRPAALAMLNAALQREGFEAFYGEDGLCYLRHVKTQTVASATMNAHRPLTRAETEKRGRLASYLDTASEDDLIEQVLLPLFRSEEHTSELQSLMRISYAVFCLK